MKKIILMVFSVVFVLTIFPIVEAKNLNDLTSYQKQKYWVYIKECSPLLLNKEYNKYRICALAAFEKASQEKETNAWCTDSDSGKDFLTKGIVKTDIYPEGKEDYVKTFPSGATYLMEGFCSSKNQYAFAQKKCSDFGKKYYAKDGACVYENQPPILTIAVNTTEINEGDYYKIYLYGSDADNDNLTFSAENLPEGAEINEVAPVPFPYDKEVAIFSWMPSYSQAGEYTIKFSISDGEKDTSVTTTIKVNNVNQPPVLDTIGNKEIFEGEELSFNISATDPDGDALIFSAQNLPEGANFDGNTFSWMPNYGQAGEYEVTFKVNDGNIIDSDLLIITVINQSYWSPTSNTNVPTGRYLHTAIWTGKEMIVWGGSLSNGNTNTGGRYNPNVDSWILTPMENVPSARSWHTAVWTGKEMIIWGGDIADSSGGRYNPTTNIWTPMSTINAPSPRVGHTAIWTGEEMIIWGGCNPFSCSESFNTGFSYNPETNIWKPLSVNNAPDSRLLHAAVWTGKEMIIWGGCSDGDCSQQSLLNTGARYNPAIDIWTSINTEGAPLPRYNTLNAPAVWTGFGMIIWGGCKTSSFPSCSSDSFLLNEGAIYNPTFDLWTEISVSNGPSKRILHTMIWTGIDMVVWGGIADDGAVNTGGHYNPNTNLWIKDVAESNVPQYRAYHTAIWTGSEMIIWGGSFGSGLLSTGGLYKP